MKFDEVLFLNVSFYRSYNKPAAAAAAASLVPALRRCHVAIKAHRFAMVPCSQASAGWRRPVSKQAPLVPAAYLLSCDPCHSACISLALPSLALPLFPRPVAYGSIATAPDRLKRVECLVSGDEALWPVYKLAWRSLRCSVGLRQ